eukprot:CAMPEP_0113673812 /NCGR_PEP_ID=MMETSP0038_2-20120614/7060_1 /TAXON_ID=2898 /ORGANISM="Cryptomonas paramecium" /LENGTH=82 /DNA_ID=CAMNT_0000590301 /DNA_START=1040 /DNA_END=1284 /DNA_ORIENTATION=+ /assembly_acc=CAM_ASM_000170
MTKHGSVSHATRIPPTRPQSAHTFLSFMGEGEASVASKLGEVITSVRTAAAYAGTYIAVVAAVTRVKWIQSREGARQQLQGS